MSQVVRRGVTKVTGTAPVAVSPASPAPVVSVPPFGASGIAHAAGLVPDPGSSAGTTKYLREDATWDAPPGAGSDATPSTVGLVEIDQSPASGHPVALTRPRYGTAGGVTPLGDDTQVPSAFLATPVGGLAEQGRWTKSANNPILQATAAWEENGGHCVVEPSVLYDNGTWKMWYRGSWFGPGAIGLATCPGTSDPTDGANWTKYAGNPVLNLSVIAPHVVKLTSDGTYRLYYSGMGYATSPDGITWTDQGAIPSLSGGNSIGLLLTSDGIWHCIIEKLVAGTWALYGYTSPDGLTWTATNSGSALSTLQVGTGSYSHAALLPYPIGGLYQVYYHASTSGTLPSDVYRATSPDLVTWTQVAPNPILTHAGGGSFEHDQLADPYVLEVNGLSYLFYDGDNNSTNTAAIGVATFAGTLHELINGAALPGVGTVTSVALTVPADETVTGSPITGSGTLAITRNAQPANEVLAGPASGASATPGYRALVPADLPLATSSAFGAVKPDNSTVTVSAGVLSAVGGGGGGSYGSSLIRTPNPNTFVSTAAADQPPDFVVLSTGDIIGVGGR